MSDQGSSPARRAFGPLPPDDGHDDPSPATAAVGRRGTRALPYDESWTPADADTQILRRLAASPASPTPVTTPVPPPVPVMPESATGLPTSAGRRFSAAEPSEFSSAAPRRSAASVSSPDLPEEFGARPARWVAPSTHQVPTVTPVARAVPLPPATGSAAAPPAAAIPPVAAALTPSGAAFTPPASRTPGSAAEPSAAPAATWSAGSASERTVAAERTTPPGYLPAEPVAAEPGETTSATPAPVRRSGRRALLLIVGVVVVALVVAGVVWVLGQRPAPVVPPQPSPTTTTSAPVEVLDPLVTPADAAGLAGTSWTAETTTGSESTPLCLLAAGTDSSPTPDRSTQRELTASASTGGTLLQVVETYADDTTASSAYDLRVGQLSNCTGVQAMVTSSWEVPGLADAAVASQLLVQAADADSYHTVLVSRTGRTVSLAEVVTPEPVGATDLAGVIGKALGRICSGGDGTCPTSTTATETDPLASDPLGWLGEVDLPRVTAGTGRWAATDPFSTLTVLGSHCEAVDLVAVPDTESAEQRTLLLADDPAAPIGFGIDQVVYSFTDTGDAKTFFRKLTSNLAGCPDREPTASVTAAPQVSGEVVDGTEFLSRTYLVSQKTNANDSVAFRVGVIRLGQRVSYLIANPTAEFDFTTAQWRAIVARVVIRVGQG